MAISLSLVAHPRPTGISIRPIAPTDTYPLRHAVLWPDKPAAYVQLPEDADGHHYGAFLGDELVAVISLFINGPVARFRKFATRPAQQGNGIGTALLRHTFAEARRLGADRIGCDARLSAAPFYHRFGMQPTGAVFYKGTIPYQRYETSLETAL